MKRLVYVALALSFGCTDVRLWKPGELERISVELERPVPVEPTQTWGFVPKPGETIRYRIGDVFCTNPSKELTVPFKLLIIMDYSGSMDQSDPNGLRIQAVQQLVNRYSGDRSVYFGFLRFGGTVFPLDGLGQEFTNDPNRIASALQALAANNTVPDGATNYQESLEWAWEAIDEDMRKEDQIPGTRYGIIFVTDGRPNVPEGGNEDQALQANVPKVHDRITGCYGYKSFQPLNTMIEWLNTYFINVGGPDPQASELLRRMAEGTGTQACDFDNWGHGLYTEVQNAGDLDFQLDLPTLRKVFVNRSGFAFIHHHLKAAYKDGEMVMARDSDGDGIPDFEESMAPSAADLHASSMFSADTDGDGISDLVEYSLGMASNDPAPLTIYDRPPVDATLAQDGMLVQLGKILPSDLDTDGDGLTDAEEDFIGTDHLVVDTDRDGLSDYVELRFGLNPNDPTDAALDGDGDGFDSKAEIEMGMDPHHREPAWFREAYAYNVHRGQEFQVEDPVAGGSPRVRSCYNFNVSNILFRRPLLANGTEGNYNVFELSFIDQTRLPISEFDYVSRREAVKAIPENDKPAYYFRREFPSTW